MLNHKRKIIILSLPIFILILFIASTNTLAVLGGLAVYISTLILIFLISLYTDSKLQTKFKFIALILFIVSLFATFLGISTFTFQEKLNYNRATKFILDLEEYKVKYGKYPVNEDQIDIPNSRNGLWVEKFQYIPDIDKDSYIVKYFDGFWDTKVYVESRKQWYTDD